MMATYIETIRLENGHFHLLDLHSQRMAATIGEAFGHAAEVPDLEGALRAVGSVPSNGTYKCRIVYDSGIREIEILPYEPRIVKSLRAVAADPRLDYHLKSCDRSALTALAAQRGNCDEVIITRDGFITDTSYTNLLLHGRDGIYTPRRPLLRGVMRQHLLNEGLIKEADLTLADLAPDNPLGITRVTLINAMLPPATAPVIPIDKIQLY